MTRPVAIRNLMRYSVPDAPPAPDQDLVAVEAPLTLRVQPVTGPPVSLGVLMRTPGHDEDLVAGVLLAEGVIDHRGMIRAIHTSADAVVVDVTADADLDAAAGRASAATSACGLCGRLELLRIETTGGSGLAPAPVVEAALLASLPDRLRAAQPAFGETGGLHAAGLFDASGRLLAAREDVGRHNAVDKVTGWLLREGRPGSDTPILTVSGRVAYEIVQKAARAGLAIIVAVGAPSDLAVDAAQSAGITLVGFARGGRFNAYSWPARVSASATAE